MDINSNILKITGGSELSGSLDPKKEIKFSGTLAIYSVEYKDKQDGTYDRIYKAKFIGEIEAEDGVNKLVGKPKSPQSQKLRQALWYVSEQDCFYEIFMDKLIPNAEDVWEFLKNR